MPVSLTLNASNTRPWLSAGPASSADTDTEPLSVNFTALLTRLIRICRRRVTSPRIAVGGPPLEESRTSTMTSMPFSRARGAEISQASSIMLRTLTGSRSRSNLPDSIFEKSRISLITASNWSLERRMVCRKSRCSVSSEVSASSALIPTTPLSGVRISWLMVARNAALARTAASASSRARTSSDSRDRTSSSAARARLLSTSAWIFSLRMRSATRLKASTTSPSSSCVSSITAAPLLPSVSSIMRSDAFCRCVTVRMTPA